ALLCRAELAYDRGDYRSASEQAARYLRRVPTHNRTERASGLELVVRANVALGDLDGARDALVELTGIARIASTLPLQAVAYLASGWVAMATGDHDGARRLFEDAVDGFVRSGAPFEAARARLDLARVLVTLERREAAAEEAQRAIDLLTELKAELELAHAHDVMASVRTEPAPRSPARSN